VIEEILPNFFRARIPLPDSPLKFLNAYLIKGQPRNLIVDTGLNRAECRRAMADSVRAAGMDLRETDFLITHAHADHIGIAKELAGDHSRVFISAPDALLLSKWTSWEGLFPIAATYGFPKDELGLGIEGNRNMGFRGEDVPQITVFEEGHAFSVGDYCFEPLATPGHSPGHTCLYEPKRKLLLSGDHILDEISPNITSWRAGNPLRDYLASLEKVDRLDVDLVLPGHRSPLGDLRRRIRELQDHHADRLRDVLSLLAGGARTPYELASQMQWDLAGSWARWAFTQRWFALGEALANLRYLEAEGAVERTERDGLVFFRRR
jgi:glyoxylase-like metal-dependent hydrolase (beta-lactamase superfamily II)